MLRLTIVSFGTALSGDDTVTTTHEKIVLEKTAAETRVWEENRATESEANVCLTSYFLSVYIHTFLCISTSEILFFRIESCEKHAASVRYANRSWKQIKADRKEIEVPPMTVEKKKDVLDKQVDEKVNKKAA
jgi:hypothetical protein